MIIYKRYKIFYSQKSNNVYNESMGSILKNIKLATLYGFLIWLIPFILSIILFPLHEQERPFFESIMPVALAFITVYFAIKYHKSVESHDSWQEGLLLGLLWMAIAIIIDLPLFSYILTKMAFSDYWKDIGFTYLLIPIITTSLAIRIFKDEARPHSA